MGGSYGFVRTNTLSVTPYTTPSQHISPQKVTAIIKNMSQKSIESTTGLKFLVYVGPHHRARTGRNSHAQGGVIMTERIAYRPDEAAAILGVSPRSLFNMRKSGLIPTVKVGRMVLITHEAICEFIESNNSRCDVPGRDGGDA